MGNPELVRKKLVAGMIKNGEIAVAHLDNVCRNAKKVNEDLLMNLLRKNAKTEFGIRHHFSDIHSVDDFRREVPLTDYSDFAPYVARMVESGEKNLLTTESVLCYVTSSGTSGVDKRVPLTPSAFKLMGTYTSSYQFGMLHRTLGDLWSDGMILNLAEICEEKTESGAVLSHVSSQITKAVGNMTSMFFTSPTEAMYAAPGKDSFYLHLLAALRCEDVTEIRSTFITITLEMFHYLEKHWEVLVSDIERGQISESICIAEESKVAVNARLTAQPERAAALRAVFAQGFETPVAPRIWKRLACISGVSGASFAPYLEQCRRYIGDLPVYNYGITATEGLFAVPYELNNASYIMTPDTCFYEFAPVDGEAGQTLLLHELEIGKEYSLVITNLAGFYRYQMGDILRVVGWHAQSPIVEFVSRAAHLSSICGEKVNEKLLLLAMEAATKDIEIVDFSAYTELDAKPKGFYIFLVELAQGQEKPDTGKMAQAIQKELGKWYAEMDSHFSKGLIGAPQILFLKSGTYDRYREMQAKRKGVRNQIKPMRILNSPELREWFLNEVE